MAEISNSSIKILVADDSSAICTLLDHTLTKMGYDVTVCSNGNDAWQRIKKENYHMMIFDWVMPGITGTELCKKIRTLRGDSYRYIILLTGNDGANDIIEGLKSGADDYLVKPVSIAQLKARINVGRRLIAYETELKNTEKDIRLSCYRTLTELAEARDYETGAHLARIAGLSKRLAQEYGCDEEFCNQIELFSPMHDIGKVGIPDGILHLPRALNPSEFEIMKSHAQIGWQILKDKETLEVAAEIAYTHHEKWNGTGYPRRLKGEEIPLTGRIVAVADVYDAMRSARPYKTAFSHDETSKWIIQQSEQYFDPQVIEAYARCEYDLKAIFDSQYDSKKMDFTVLPSHSFDE